MSSDNLNNNSSSSSSHKNLVTLPNPWEDPENFGRRLSRWARPEAGASGASDGGGGASAMSFDGDTLLKVSLGYWNNIAQPRHMEMILKVQHLPQSEKNDEEKIVHYQSNRCCSLNTPQSKHIWIMNCYMGGDNMVVLTPDKLGRSQKKANAPLVLAQDVSRRKWAAKGLIVQKEWLEVYHMKASTFEHLLKRLIRWGFAVGSSQEFRFHPFLFLNDSLQPPSFTMSSLADSLPSISSSSNKNRHQAPPKKEDLESSTRGRDHLDFINCQGSVALLTTWWMQEAGHLLTTDTTTTRYTIRMPAIHDFIAPKIAPHILIEPRKICFLWCSSSKTRTETIERLTKFLESDAVARAMEMDDDEVTRQIELYETRKRGDGYNNDNNNDNTANASASFAAAGDVSSSGGEIQLQQQEI